MRDPDPFKVAAGDLKLLNPAKMVPVPGYLTVPQAVHFLADKLFLADIEGSVTARLKPYLPCAIDRQAGEPVAFSRRVFFQGRNGPRSKRVVLPIQPSESPESIAGLNRIFTNTIFRSLLSKELTYKLVRVDTRTVLPNRPELRMTIGAQVRKGACTYETGFVWRGENLCVLLLDKRSLEDQSIVQLMVKAYVSARRNRLDADTIAMFEAFASVLRSVSPAGLLFRRPELFDACKGIASRSKQLRLTDRIYRSQLWDSQIFSGLKLSKNSGKQFSQRKFQATRALEHAKRTFFADPARQQPNTL